MCVSLFFFVCMNNELVLYTTIQYHEQQTVIQNHA